MLVGHRQHSFFGYTTEPLIEDFDADAEDEFDLIERVRAHGVLDSDTEGSVLATGDGRRYWGYYGGHSSSYAHKFTYEEWVAQQDAKPPSPKAQARAELIQHWKQLKKQKDYDEAFLRSEYQRGLAQSSMGLRGWAKQQEAQTPEQREATYAKQVENAAAARQKRKENDERIAEWQRESALTLQRKADEAHERSRLWSIEVSEIERSIFECTENIDCSVLDRAMMRTMLRYQNFGPGKGKPWDAREFALYISATRRDDLLTMTLRDVERCYDVLKNMVVNA